MRKINLFSVLFFFLIAGCTAPQYEVNVTPSKMTTPVFIRKQENSLLTLKVNNPTDREICVTSITLTPDGTTQLSDIESVRAYFTGNSAQFNPNVLFGQPSAAAKNIRFKGKQFLKPGDNYFWVSVTLKPEADLTHNVNMTCQDLTIEDARVNIEENSSLRPSAIGYAVRQRNDDGSKSYRIPGMVCTPKGTLITVYDIRWNNSADLQEDIDVGVSRSLDGGQTWLPMQKAIDMGE